MRVTMLLRCLAMMRGGGETRHLEWARELTASGVDVHIITGQPLLFGGVKQRMPDCPVTMLRSPYTRNFVYRYQNQRGFGRLTMYALHMDEEWFCRAAWRRIAEAEPRPDIVHAHALYQAARLRRDDIPVVINLPGAPHPRYRRDLQKADALIADGWAADHLGDSLGRTVDRVSKGVDAERFNANGPNLRAALRLEAKRVVLTVARLVPIKNVALLVDAVAQLRQQLGDAHLLIVGNGPEAAAIKSRVAANDLTDAVTFAGEVAHAETPLYYRTADVFALTSHFDNSPNAVLEAMASGLPVVTTDVGGVREFVQERGGVVVPAHEAAAIAAGLNKYLASRVAAREAGVFNRARAATEFSWRTSARRLLDVYDRVVSRGVAA